MFKLAALFTCAFMQLLCWHAHSCDFWANILRVWSDNRTKPNNNWRKGCPVVPPTSTIPHRADPIVTQSRELSIWHSCHKVLFHHFLSLTWLTAGSDTFKMRTADVKKERARPSLSQASRLVSFEHQSNALWQRHQEIYLNISSSTHFQFSHCKKA